MQCHEESNEGSHLLARKFLLSTTSPTMQNAERTRARKRSRKKRCQRRQERLAISKDVLSAVPEEEETEAACGEQRRGNPLAETVLRLSPLFPPSSGVLPPCSPILQCVTAIAAQMKLLKFSSGARLWTAGEAGDSLVVVAAGRVFVECFSSTETEEELLSASTKKTEDEEEEEEEAEVKKNSISSTTKTNSSPTTSNTNSSPTNSANKVKPNASFTFGRGTLLGELNAFGVCDKRLATVSAATVVTCWKLTRADLVSALRSSSRDGAALLAAHMRKLFATFFAAVVPLYDDVVPGKSSSSSQLCLSSSLTQDEDAVPFGKKTSSKKIRTSPLRVLLNDSSKYSSSDDNHITNISRITGCASSGCSQKKRTLRGAASSSRVVVAGAALGRLAVRRGMPVLGYCTITAFVLNLRNIIFGRMRYANI